MEPTLLIVDDNADQVDLLAHWFSLNGWQVVGVVHPRLALREASCRKFQVALLDLSLPEMDGIRLMQKLKRIQEELQFVFLTGYDFPTSEAKVAGAYACLTKPCSLAMLKARVVEAFERTLLACDANPI